MESDIITVREGQDAKIKCSYRSAYGNIKYFCKDPCTETDILVKSDWYQSLPKRFSLVDHGSSFTVTISKVRSTDSGLYFCGVDRIYKDTFKEITLEVITGEFSLYFFAVVFRVLIWDLCLLWAHFKTEPLKSVAVSVLCLFWFTLAHSCRQKVYSSV